MTGTTEKAICSACGVDVRENTVYCYNCGGKLDSATSVETNGAVGGDEESRAALDDLAEKLRHGSESERQLANAATERKKARVTHRKRNELTWEPRDDSSISALIFSAVVAFIALIVVILLVVWK